MARPRQYHSAAAKQAAYRQRLAATTTMVDRSALAQLHTQLDDLQQAIWAAAQHGDPIARQCATASVATMLDRLIALFRSYSTHT